MYELFSQNERFPLRLEDRMNSNFGPGAEGIDESDANLQRAIMESSAEAEDEILQAALAESLQAQNKSPRQGHERTNVVEQKKDEWSTSEEDDLEKALRLSMHQDNDLAHAIEESLKCDTDQKPTNTMEEDDDDDIDYEGQYLLNGFF